MIVRDEADTLTQCLESARKYVEQIIIVDTGSEDGTVGVARDHGAEVFRVEWMDDFSRARNTALSQASCEWILVLDADEELSERLGRALAGLVKESGVDAYTFRVVSPSSNSMVDGVSRHQSLRLFRNRADYRYCGRIHEQVMQVTEDGPRPLGRVKDTDLEIMHYGYLGTTRGSRTQRNLELLRLCLREEPNNAFYHFNLGVSLHVLRQIDLACVHYTKALKLAPKSQRYVATLYRNLCICLHQLGRYEECYNYIEDALSYFPDYGDLHFIRSQVFWDVGALDLSIRSLEKCISLTNAPVKYTTTEGVSTYLAFENLAEAYFKKAQFNEARTYLERALQYHSSTDTLTRWVQANHRLNIKGPALLMESSRLKSSLPDLVAALSRAGDHAACAELHIQAGAPETRILIAKSLVCERRLPEAREILIDLCANDYGLILYCLSYWVAEPRQSIPCDVGAGSGSGSVVTLLKHIDNYLFRPDATSMDSGPNGSDGVRIAAEALALRDTELAIRIAEAVVSGGNTALARLNVARHAVKKGWFADSRVLLEPLLSHSGSPAEVYYLLGVACEQTDIGGAGLDLLQKAMEMSPSNDAYIRKCKHATAKRLMGNLIEALEHHATAPHLARLLFSFTSLRKQLMGSHGGMTS